MAVKMKKSSMKTAPNGSTPAIMVLKKKTFVFIPLIHTTRNLYKSAHQKIMVQNTL
jgi:hypothetical protein